MDSLRHRRARGRRGCERDQSGRRIDRELRGREFAARHGDAQTAGHRLHDFARIGRKGAAVGLGELKRISRAVALPDRLIARRRRLARRRRGMVGAIAPAKAVEPAAPLLEEIDDVSEIGEGLDAIARLPAPPRARPARIAPFAVGAERHHIGAPFGPAARTERDIERKQDFVETGHEPPHAREGANLIQNNAPDGAAARLWPQSQGDDQACRMLRTS